MFVVSEADAAAIRTAYEQEGELSAAIELRRRFPGITDKAEARECVRTIASWKTAASTAAPGDAAASPQRTASPTSVRGRQTRIRNDGKVREYRPPVPGPTNRTIVDAMGVVMTKRIDPALLTPVVGTLYPSPFDAPSRARQRRKLGHAAGLTQFGIDLITLPPGACSSQRHWHTESDEFIYVLSGEITLVTDAAAAAKPRDGMVTSATTAILSTACAASRWRCSTWSIVTRCSRAWPIVWPGSGSSARMLIAGIHCSGRK